jgi:hypothetical protein
MLGGEMRVTIPFVPPGCDGEIECADCGETVWQEDKTPGKLMTDAEELIRLIQVHMYACPKKRMNSSENCPYHPGIALYYFRAASGVFRCEICNRTITPAELMAAKARRAVQ